MADKMWSELSTITWGGALISYGESRPVYLGFGTTAGKFYQADGPDSGAGLEDLATLIERVGLPLVGPRVSPSSVKLITGVWLLVEGTPGEVLHVYLGAQEESPQDTVNYQGPYNFTIGDTEFIDTWISGRYAAIKITYTGDMPWSLIAYELEFEPVGIH